MCRVAERLPMRFSNFWGFECRLSDPEPSADILFEIKKEALGPAFLAGESPSLIDDLCEAYPAWKTFRALAKDWTNPGHAWNRDIRNLWLEMDLIGSDTESVMRRPNIFFGPEQKTSNARILGLIEGFMRVFERSASQACALLEFFDCLPEGARIFQVGFMLGRANDTGIRLCVNKVAQDQVLPWLTRLCPGMSAAEAASLKNGLETVSALCHDVDFGFNLTEEGVGDSFGVECYEDWLDEDPAQWRPLLDELTRAGLCLPEKAQGVRDYAGITASPLSKRVVSDVVYLNTYRKIHHLKVTASRGALTQAKAYLAVSRPGVPLSLFGLTKALNPSGLSSAADKQAGQAWSTR
jgi:hypothetical protein